MRALVVIAFLITLPVSAQEIKDINPEVVCLPGSCPTGKSGGSGFWEDQFRYLRIEPRVFEIGYKGPFTLTAGVVDSTVQGVEIRFSPFNQDDSIFDREGRAMMYLEDGGIDGDETAGDFVFTANNVFLTYDETAIEEAIAVMGHSRFTIVARYPDGSKSSYNLMFAASSPLDMFAYNPAHMPFVNLRQLSENVVASDHIINIAYDEVTEPSQFWEQEYHNCDVETNEDCILEEHITDLFQFVANEYDHLVTIRANLPSPDSMFTLIANPIEGIGAKRIENTRFPFASRLVGVTDYRVSWEPRSVSYILTEGLLQQYQYDFTPWDEVSDRPDLAPRWGNGEWGDSQYGQDAFVVGKSGFGTEAYYRVNSVEQLTESTWRIHYDWSEYVPQVEYNDVELYLMGLMSPEENPKSFNLFWGWDAIEFEPQYTGYRDRPMATVFEVDSVEVVSVDEMIAWGGPRIPSAEQQSNSWNVLYFVPFYRTMTAEELAVYEYYIKEYEKEQSDVLETTFFQATRGRGRLSSLISFREGVGVDSDELPTRLSISSVYPNPATTSASVRLELDTSGPVTLEVFDLLGRSVAASSETFFNAGVHEVRLEISQLSTGVYYVRIKAQGNSDTRPLLVTK